MRVDNFITKPEPKSTEKKTIHIVHILDSSGSMGDSYNSKWSSAVQGVRSEISELKLDLTVNYVYSLVVFGASSKQVIWQQPINKVKYESDWRSQSSTALYDTIKATLSNYPQGEPVLVKILTDGASNSDRTSPSEIKQLIDSLQEKDFTITFVGTADDVEYINKTLGIAEGNTLVHDNTAEGVMRSFKKSMGATMSYASNVAEGKFTKTLNFYTTN